MLDPRIGLFTLTIVQIVFDQESRRAQVSLIALSVEEVRERLE